MSEAEPAVGIAAFAVDRAGCRTLDVQSAPSVRSASVSKPLLGWVAATRPPFSQDADAWGVLCRAAVTISDNDAMAELWARAGEDRLLASLNERLGTRWGIDGDGEHPALRVMVTADELAHAYAELAADRTSASIQVRRRMCEVPLEQTFGLRSVACGILGVEDGAVGVKCGWFGGERAHAILLVEAQGRIVGAAVTTTRAPDPITRAAVQAAVGDNAKLAAAHDEAAGDHVRSGVRRALLAVADL